jgi:hypothetical protein
VTSTKEYSLWNSRIHPIHEAEQGSCIMLLCYMSDFWWPVGIRRHFFLQNVEYFQYKDYLFWKDQKRIKITCEPLTICMWWYHHKWIFMLCIHFVTCSWSSYIGWWLPLKTRCEFLIIFEQVRTMSIAVSKSVHLCVVLNIWKVAYFKATTYQPYTLGKTF